MSPTENAPVSLSWLALATLASICACSGSNGNANQGARDAASDSPPWHSCAPGSSGCGELDPTVPTNLADASKFLYTGEDPVQKGVVPGAIDPVHVSVLRGEVFERSTSEPSGEAPLSGVTVVVVGHPELGFTQTAGNGWFSMAVNGGGVVSVALSKKGYLSAQRSVSTRWLDYAIANDALLTQPEPGETVTLSASSAGFQVVRGKRHGGARAMSPAEDDDGARTATLLVPPGTTASDATLNDKPITIRATELTTGSLGIKAMPAELAPTTAYTYAVDFGIDEADGASVTFNQPVVFYLENFIGLPVGDGKSATPMPMGYYDRGQSAWVPVESGQVARVLANDGSTVTLELDGSGTPATDTDFTPPIYEGERAEIAKLYAKGTEIWRIGVPHFSDYDANLGFAPPDDAGAPSAGSPNGNGPQDDGCKASGSIIECENQILAEEFPVSGTPWVLRYQSERTLGNLATLQVRIPLTGKTALTPDVETVQAFVHVAGRSFKYTTTSRAADQAWTWTWDRKDAFGRVVSGSAVAQIGVGYTYQGQSCPYVGTKKFGFWGNGTPITANRALKQTTLWQYFEYPIEHIDAKTTFGFGGLSLSAQNLYDASGPMFWGGDGTRRSILGTQLDVITTYAGGNAARTNPGDGGKATKAQLRPQHLALASDGTLYIADIDNNLVRKVTSSGVITSIAGNGKSEDGTSGDHGNGDIATKVAVSPYGVAVGPDGTLYVTTKYTNRVRKIDPKTHAIQTIAGNGAAKAENCMPAAACHDGEVATEIPLSPLGGVAVGPDGAVYFTETTSGSGRIRRLDLDGTLATVTSALGFPDGLSFARDGSLYVADSNGVAPKFGPAVLKVSPAGKLSIVAGGKKTSFGGDGGPATKAGVWPGDVVVAPNGGYFIADTENHRVRYVDASGIIRTISGTGGCASGQPIGDDGPEGAASLCYPSGLALTSQGTLYIADSWHDRVRVIAPPIPGYTLDSAFIPDPTGSVVWEFDAEGRHLSTHDATNGQTLLTLSYDSHGLLSKVTDLNDATTTIDRSVSGKVTIGAPFGQKTVIRLDKDGYASSVTDAAGAETRLTYAGSAGAENGLLATLTDPKGQVHSFQFSSEGLLTQDDNPAGGRTTLARTPTPTGWRITTTSRLGRATTFDDSLFDQGGEQRVMTAPSGVQTTFVQALNGTQTLTVTGADGTVLGMTATTLGADPRFQSEAPIAASSTTTTGGITSTVDHTRVVKTSGEGLFDLASQTDTVTVKAKSGAPQTVESVYTHGATSNTLAVTTGLGRATTATLDAHNRLLSVATPGTGTQSFAYNTSPCPGSEGCGGRVTSVTWTSANPKEGTRTVSPKYASSPDMGLASAIVDSLGRTTSLTYDPVGRVTGATLPALSGSKASENLIALAYDANGNLASLALPSSGGVTRVHAFPSYSPIDELLTYEPPQATPALATRETLYAYDTDGELTDLSAPDTAGYAKVHVTWDAAGRIAEVADPKGATVSLDYAKSGLLQQLTTSDGISLALAHQGLLLTGATWSGPVSGAIVWTYDDFFRFKTRTVGTAVVAYAYDADGLYVGTTAPASFVVTRDAGGKNGLVASSILGSVKDGWTYNGFGEPSGYAASFGATSLYTMSGVTRDPAGRITAMTETVSGTSHTWSFAYDEHGDLTEAKRDGVSHTWAFDTNGNRTSVDGVAQGPYDAQDRLTTSGYAYTPNGDLAQVTTGAGTTTYAYDLSGSLRAITLPSGDSVSYVIDGLGRRIGKKLTHGGSSITQGFLYDDQLRVAAQLDGSSAVVSVFVYGERPNVPDYVLRGGNTYRLVSDWRGSVRAVVDATAGTVVQTLDYDAWGNVTSATDATCGGGPTCFSFQPFGFEGGLYDKETGLVRFGARDYDPSVGRWTQKDGSGLSGGTNLYLFANGDPVDWFDPDGHVSLACAAASLPGALASGVVSAALNFSKQAFNATVNSFCGGDTSVDWNEVAISGVEAALGDLAFGAASCFVAGTPVTMCDGSREPIQTLREGDMVLSRSAETGWIECKPVVQTFEHVADDVARLEVANADEPSRPIEALNVTRGHPFWVEGKGWIRVAELEDRDQLFSASGRALVVRGLAARGDEARVFNLEVEGDHSYFVGDPSVWVHNACVIGRGADLDTPGALGPGEYRLQWPSLLPDFDAELAMNGKLLQNEINLGLPIRDASPGNTGGTFLNFERNMLGNAGWTFDSATNFWSPPGK